MTSWRMRRRKVRSCEREGRQGLQAAAANVWLAGLVRLQCSVIYVTIAVCASGKE